VLVSFCPDGRHAATAGPDGVRLWEARTGKEVRAWQEPGNFATLAFSPDGKLLLAARGDSRPQGGPIKPESSPKLWLWDLATGKPVLERTLGFGGAKGVAFSADGRRLGLVATAASAAPIPVASPPSLPGPLGPDRKAAERVTDEAALLLDPVTGQEYGRLAGLGSLTYDLAASPDGRFWATIDLDGNLQLFDAGTYRLIRKILVADRPNPSHGRLSFSADGRWLALPGWDMGIELWPTSGEAEVLTLRTREQTIQHVAYSPDGRRLATAGAGSAAVLVWETSSGRITARLGGGIGRRQAKTVAWSADGKRVATAHGPSLALTTTLLGALQGMTGPGGEPGAKPKEDHPFLGVVLWDAATGKELHTIEMPSSPHIVAFSPDGKYLAIGHGDLKKGWVDIWEADGCKRLMRQETGAEYVHNLAWAPDSQQLASAAAMGKEVDLWDPQTGKKLTSLRIGFSFVSALAYSSDGRWLATGSQPSFADRRGEVRIFDRRTGQEARLLRGHESPVVGLAFSADSRRVFSNGGDATLKVWDTSNGQDILTLPTGLGLSAHASSLAASPDGSWLAVGLGDTIQLWDGRPYPEVMFARGATWTAASRDRRTLAARDSEGTIRVWGAAGHPLLTLPSAERTSQRVALHLDRGRLAFGKDDRVQVLDTRTGKLLSLEAGMRPVWAVAYALDGRLAAVGGGRDETGKPAPVRVRVWGPAGGEPLVRFEGPSSLAAGMALTADLQHILEVGPQGVGRAWNLETGEIVPPPRGVPGAVEIVAEPTGLVAINQKVRTGFTDAIRILDIWPRAGLSSGTDRLRPDSAWHAAEAESARRQKHWQAAVFHLERSLSGPPADQDQDLEWARVCDRFGRELTVEGLLAQAERAHRRALTLFDKFLKDKPDGDAAQQQRLDTLVSLGRILRGRQEHGEAARALRPVVERGEEVLGKQPGNLEYRILLMRALVQLGASQREQGRQEEALKTLTRVVELGQKAPPGSPEAVRDEQLSATLARVSLLLQMHRTLEAVDGYHQAEKLLEQLTARGPWLAEAGATLPGISESVRRETADTLLSLGRALLEAGRPAQAESALRWAVVLARKLATIVVLSGGNMALLQQWFPNLDTLNRPSDAARPAGRVLLIRGLVQMGSVLSGLDRAAEAEAAFEEALQEARRPLSAGSASPDQRRLLADAETAFGLHLLRAGQRPRAAELAFRRALPLREQLVKELPESEAVRGDLAEIRQKLAAALLVEKNNKEAVPLLEKAGADWQALAERHPDAVAYRASRLRVQADLARAGGKPEEAARLAEQFATLTGADGDALADAAAILALCAAGATDEAARAHAGRAVQVLQELVKKSPHDFRLADRLRHDPDFQSLRQRPEFQKLRDQMLPDVK
jgi:WD40 repeat protein/tetratricopeptide (TPR) repeat protein